MKALLALPSEPTRCHMASGSGVPQRREKLGGSQTQSNFLDFAFLPPQVCKVACIASLAASLLSCPDALAYEKNTPFSKLQSQKMELGLLNGKIRPCPSDVNPNCISTSSMNAKYALPLVIPPESTETATRKLISAIETTQGNPKVTNMEDTPTGRFLQIEVDGLFGRDVIEFLVKNDVVTYRSLAMKVLYVYPFTTPISDFGTQEKHMKAIEEELGWTVPTWDSDY
ncbi:hypothetical protein KP509_09G053800 [Ceratopteris richardii]|uniref:Thylakoid lumenal 17.9 kDa protein, chloroplastic n=1 Tax=Ceratopteris richardii TaxID=49495 RepID=A0A8T2U6X4_CERRI|nr:hypothetical protein KP509_09G053800 [Ceratopteris richardii]